MFEKFTDRARRVVVLAQEEARLLHHGYIGTEHLLLALFQVDGITTEVLEGLDVDLSEARAKVEELVSKGRDEPRGHIPFTPRAKKVLELSMREALQLGHNYIGTEHILLGLVREGEGVAAQVLQQMSVKLHEIRQATIQALDARGTPPSEDMPREVPLLEITAMVEANLDVATTAIKKALKALDNLREVTDLPESPENGS